MKLSGVCLTLALLGLSSQARAAGETVTLLATVQDSVLGGYVATLPVGWTQTFLFGAASPSTTAAASQQFYAYNQPYPTVTYPTRLPPNVQITRVSSTGAILTKDLLPAAVQVVQADCTLPNYTSPAAPTYNACPFLTVGVTQSKALPGRLIVSISKPAYTVATATNSAKQWAYVFDPGATLSTDRWVLAGTRTLTVSGPTGTPALTVAMMLPMGSFTPADTNVFIFQRPTTTSTSISSVVPK